MGIISKILDDEVKRLKKDVKSSSKQKRFSPSIIGSKCERKVFYSYNRAEEITSSVKISAKRAQVIGNYFGDMYADLLRSSGVLIDYYDKDGKTPMGPNNQPSKEFPVDAPELDIKKGYIDAVIVIKNKGKKELWLGENKAISQFSYEKLTKEGISTTYYYQCLIYLYLFNKKLKNGDYSHIKELSDFQKAEGICITHYNKGTSTIKEIEIKENSQNFKEIIKRIVRIKNHTQNNTLPPKTPDMCNYCPYKHLCDKNLIK